ncbi:MAG: polysaccharide deacetylase family protein [Chloroflexi bacterium]|nr:polysaccharide deacetylase family protein [Chloroflexota bacterium]
MQIAVNRTSHTLFHSSTVALALIFVSILLLTGCSTPASRTPDMTQVFEQAMLTATYAIVEPSANPTPLNSPTPQVSLTPEPTVIPSPTRYSGPAPTLQASFITDLLPAGGEPVSYIEDTCEYLKARLDPNNSSPGTVVMPVMFHGIAEDGTTITDNMNVTHSDMVTFVEHAHELGFETVTTEELVGFLEENAPIPARSLYIVLDDRRPGGVREHFMHYLKEYDWTLTLAWLIGDTDTRAASPLGCCPDEPYTTLWEQMEAYNATGYLDVQSHGNIHNINITEASTDEYILSELNVSRTVIREHFYCKDYSTGLPIENCQTDQPLAFIWPGGSFTPRSVQLARENGYRLGFTVNPRGPIMYNWIPQAQENNPATPSWIAEGPAGDPLMTLPRYWSYDAAYHLDEVANIGEQAAKYAKTHRQEELNYYSYYCQDITGEIPSLNLEN